MSNNDLLSGNALLWLGGSFLLLACFALFIGYFVEPPERYTRSQRIHIPEPVRYNEDADNLFDRINFQQSQENYQRSYLQLVNHISEVDTTNINVDDHRETFQQYDTQLKRYRNARQKIDEYERTFKEKCFRRMRGLIQSIIHHESAVGDRMMILDYELLFETNSIEEKPLCPRGGTYRIINRGGRRVFNCSVHGTLRN